jgi:hypothetical protein
VVDRPSSRRQLVLVTGLRENSAASATGAHVCWAFCARCAWPVRSRAVSTSPVVSRFVPEYFRSVSRRVFYSASREISVTTPVRHAASVHVFCAKCLESWMLSAGNLDELWWWAITDGLMQQADITFKFQCVLFYMLMTCRTLCISFELEKSVKLFFVVSVWRHTQFSSVYGLL